MIIRYCKAALLAVVALFFSIIAFDNVVDYDSNWLFVQHVLSMDTIFPNSDLKWRAITDPTLQKLGYWSIIAWEALTAIVLWLGTARLVGAAGSATRFAAAKATATLGLTMGFLLYGVGFIIVGGEWFAMWQSQTWNGQQKAFEFIGMIGVALIVLLIPEQDA
jgi:predicted small integral membrane protein